jgi:sulfite exporter TauE/SafE
LTRRDEEAGVDLALILAAALMGLAGAPHCTAMCSAACGLAVRRCAPAQPLAGSAAFFAGRVAGYAFAGALAAWVVSSLGQLAATTAPLRALWTLFHLGALALGLWLVVYARQPSWLERIGAPPLPAAGTVAFVNGPVRAGAAGLAWFVLPCGLLQSALVMAALANGPLGGAAAMAAFALTSSAGLSLVPIVVRRWAGGDRGVTGVPRWAMRLAGLGLVASSGWALGHGMWERVLALCGI